MNRRGFMKLIGAVVIGAAVPLGAAVAPPLKLWPFQELALERIRAGTIPEGTMMYYVDDTQAVRPCDTGVVFYKGIPFKYVSPLPC